jgi:hypothetical protein
MSRHIEKLRVPVRLALTGGGPVDGELSLAPNAELHEGPETLLERLNARTRMVPFHRAEDGAFLLVVRTHIEWLMAGPDVAPQLVRAAHYRHTREERVRVRLLGGASFDGVLAFEMPHEFNRVSDFLNGDEDFFPLLTAQGTMLVRKDNVLDVHVRGIATERRAA